MNEGWVLKLDQTLAVASPWKKIDSKMEWVIFLGHTLTVWGNCSVEKLNRLLRIKKRFARLILNANINDCSADLFHELGWLPIDNIKKIQNSVP